MKNIKWTATLLLFGSMAAAAQAGQPYDVSIAKARVLSATPIYETVRIPSSREVCWDEEVSYRQRHSPTSTLIGGVIGGAIGHQGDQHDRTAILLDLVLSYHLIHRIVGTLGQHVGPHLVEKLSRRVLLENHHRINAIQCGQERRSLGARAHDRTPNLPVMPRRST